MDEQLDAFVHAIRDAAAHRQTLRIRGGGTKDFLGQVLEGDLLHTQAFTGIVSYEPTELVVTARCGTRVADLAALLAQQGQCLAFDPPNYSTSADTHGTVGGMVAAGLAGPTRGAVGSVRDFVLGMQMLDGRGQLLAFGGQVMKNVAGYDVSRLMAGSMGTLGVMTEVSLKVLPKPVADATLCFEMELDTALNALHRWCGQPLPLAASCWVRDEGRGLLFVRLSGAGAAVASASRYLGGEHVPTEQADADWAACRDHRLPFFTSPGADLSLWRLSLPQTAPALHWGGEPEHDQLVEWHGAQRWVWAPAHQARVVRETAEKLGGHATLFRPAKEADRVHGVYTPLAPALAAIHRQIKAALDPAGVFSPGRLLTI